MRRQPKIHRRAESHAGNILRLSDVIPLCCSELFNYVVFSQHNNKVTTIIFIVYSYMLLCSYGKGKAVPLQAWSGPEGSRKLRFQDFMTTAQDSGKAVSLTHRSPLPPESTPGTHFC